MFTMFFICICALYVLHMCKLSANWYNALLHINATPNEESCP